MAENGDTREDLTLPGGTEENDKLAAQLKSEFSEGKELAASNGATFMEISARTAENVEQVGECSHAGWRARRKHEWRSERCPSVVARLVSCLSPPRSDVRGDGNTGV